MALSFSVNCANAMLTGLKNHIIDGSDPIMLRIYSGSQPSAPDQNLNSGNIVLASFEISRPFSDDPSNKTLTAIPFSPATALASGVATFFRIGKANTALLQGTVAEAGSNADLKLNKTAFAVGEAVRVMEVKFVLP